MTKLTMRNSDSITEWLIANAEEGGETGTFVHDIATNGCSGGVPGLTYYSETSEFYDQHRNEIWDMVEEERCLDGVVGIKRLADMQFDHRNNICGDWFRSAQEQFRNALVWWAVERRAAYLVANGTILRRKDDRPSLDLYSLGMRTLNMKSDKVGEGYPPPPLTDTQLKPEEAEP